MTLASTSLTEPASIYAISSSNEIREFQLFAQFPVGSHIHYEIYFFPKAPEINQGLPSKAVVTPNSSIKVAVVRPPEGGVAYPEESDFVSSSNL